MHRKHGRPLSWQGIKQAQSSAPPPPPPQQEQQASQQRRPRRDELEADAQAAGAALVGLSWPSRLTIILVGASLLFSLFFGLEFLIAKLVGALLSGAAAGARGGAAATATAQRQLPAARWPATEAPHCAAPLASPRLDWLELVGVGRASNEARSASTRPEANCTQSSETRAAPQQVSPASLHSALASASGASNSTEAPSKLGVNFELIYEADLRLSHDGLLYELPPINHPASEQQLLVRPELKLRQLLDGYRAAMPFDPDIWTISEPSQHAHLLTGHLESCAQQLGLLLGALERALEPDTSSSEEESSGFGGDPLGRVGHQHYQLMKLLDSFGRPESGTLSGHPFWLGSYLQCQRLNELPRQRRIRLSNGTLLATRYCVGKLTLKSWPSFSSKYPSSIKVGLCLPDSCDSLSLFQLLEPTQNERLDQIKRLLFALVALNLPSETNKLYSSRHLQLVDLYCLPLERRRHLDASGLLLLLFVASWLACAILCTGLRRWPKFRPKGSNEKQKGFVEIMAVDTNLILFLGTDHERQGDGLVNLSVLDSVKHLGCSGVILAHVLLTYLTLGTSYNHTIEHVGKDMRTMFLLSLNNIVDTFFVISGLLVSYLMVKKLDSRPMGSSKEKAPSRWAKLARAIIQYVKIVAGRYARMAPLYFLVYTFAKTLSVHLGAGPLWDYATNRDSLRGLCRQESWWWPILFASDFKPITQHCVPPAWSIAVDLQFFILVPIIVALLKWASTSTSTSNRAKDKADDKASRLKRKLLISGLLGSMIVLSTLFTLIQYKSLLDYVSLRDFAKLRLHVFTVLIRHVAHAYSQPQNRMSPILIGLIGGHWLYEFERRQKRLSSEEAKGHKWPFWMRARWFQLILVLNLLFVLAPCTVQLRERARKWHGADGWGADAEETTLRLDTALVHWVQRKVLGWLLFLQTSDRFDFYLALGGFVLIKPLWSICNCIIFLRLATDLNGSLLAKLMSLRWWQALSKLNYAILLIHFELIAYESMSRLSIAQPISWSYLLGKFAFAYLFSLLLAAPLHILFEQPANRLLANYLNFSNENKPEMAQTKPAPSGRPPPQAARAKQ